MHAYTYRMIGRAHDHTLHALFNSGLVNVECHSDVCVLGCKESIGSVRLRLFLLFRTASLYVGRKERAGRDGHVLRRGHERAVKDRVCALEERSNLLARSKQVAFVHPWARTDIQRDDFIAVRISLNEIRQALADGPSGP